MRLERRDLKADLQGLLDQKGLQDLSEQLGQQEMLDLQDLQGQIAQSLGLQDLTELRDLQDRQDPQDLREQRVTMLLPLTTSVKLLTLRASQAQATQLAMLTQS